MRFSIRVRLTLWYTALMAAYLGVIVVGGYGFLAAVTLNDVDDLLARSASTVATAMEFERNGGAPDTAAVLSVAQGLKLPDIAVLVFDAATREAKPAERNPQRPVALSEDQRRELVDTMEMTARRAPPQPHLATTQVLGMDVRLFTLPYVLGRRPLVITVARSMAARAIILDEARFALGVGLPVLLMLAAVGGYWLAGKSLSPVAAMSEQARAIGGRNLHERLPVQNPEDELGQLATVLNDLLARLEAAFEAQRRLVAEASHELRTPVAVISGESEHALARADRPEAELRDALRVIREESLRLRAAIDDLFFLARADAGERRIRFEPVNLAELAGACVRAAQSRAPRRTIAIETRGGADAAILGDAELLRRVLDNLVSNAINYSTPGGPITVRVGGSGSQAEVDVIDSGPGIPPAQRERIFERFYRGEDARTLAEGTGAGLGLAIARWVA
ncbi:MAG TPA: ATP-binding protein, partial [Gemmatimonadaceae bacterium]|nr:ATP-binding protein [Gemmatimonadaceae bacterium]